LFLLWAVITLLALIAIKVFSRLIKQDKVKLYKMKVSNHLSAIFYFGSYLMLLFVISGKIVGVDIRDIYLWIGSVVALLLVGGLFLIYRDKIDRKHAKSRFRTINVIEEMAFVFFLAMFSYFVVVKTLYDNIVDKLVRRNMLMYLENDCYQALLHTGIICTGLAAMFFVAVIIDLATRRKALKEQG